MDKATFLQQAVEYIRQLQVGYTACACFTLLSMLLSQSLPHQGSLSVSPLPFKANCSSTRLCCSKRCSSILHIGLQAVMHQLISLGAVRNLPDELQWSIRMLLPRQGDSTKSASSEAVQKPVESAFSQMVPSSAYLPYMLQPQQMAMLTQHAQQASQSKPSLNERALCIASQHQAAICLVSKVLWWAAVVTQSCASVTAASPGCATQLGLHVHHQLLHAAPCPDQVLQIWQVQPCTCGVQCVCIGLETINVLDTLSMANRHTFQHHFKCNPDGVMPLHGSSVLNLCSHPNMSLVWCGLVNALCSVSRLTQS